MEAARHTSTTLRLVVDLVNELTPGHRRGRPVEAPTGVGLREAVAAGLEDRPNRARDWAVAGDEEHERLRDLAARWREVIGGTQDAGTVAPLVNALLADAPVAPSLVDHDGEPWHLHAHADGSTPSDALAATAALALAGLVADGRLGRVGTCAAAACDRAYLDLTRNGSRRYCSGACQARAKTAAYRARRAISASDTGGTRGASGANVAMVRGARR